MVDLLQIAIGTRVGPVLFFKYSNGDDAWRDLQANPPDLLVTDCNHPGRSTVDILVWLCSQSAPPPVLVVSAFGPGQRWVTEAVNRGLDATFIPKPFEPEDIWCQLKRITAKNSQPVTIFMKQNAPWLIGGASLILTALLYIFGTRYQSAGTAFIYDRWSGQRVWPKPKRSADEFLDGKKGDIFDEIASEKKPFIPPTPDQIEH